MNNKNILLPIVPFAPIVFYMIIKSNNATFEVFENYQKQTYRNRYFILAANGVIPLTIPVLGQAGKKIPVAQILIDNKLNWQEVHLRSIEAAYRSAAFYDHYINLFLPLFKNKYTKLIDFNIESLQIAQKIMGLKNEVELTTEFIDNPANTIDLRNNFKPSKENWNQFQFQNYFQVFSDKFTFQKNLSILDLIFNEGTAAKKYIE